VYPVAKRPPNLLGCRAKIGWAQRHFDTLKTYIDDFSARNKHVVVVESDAQGLRYLARVKNPPTIPAVEWALLIGDCVHNLRSALDYLVWELAGADPDDKTTMFPIFLDPKRYAKDAPRRLARLSDEVRTLVEKLQPYNSTTYGPPHKSGLWGLQTLDAADKHQLLTITAVVPESGNMVFTVPSEAEVPRFQIRGFEVPLEHDAVVAEMTFGDATPKMDMRAEITPNVAFGESLGFGRKMSVLVSLPRIIDDVERIGLLFKQRFNIAES
jgi:hypothetical protein